MSTPHIKVGILSAAKVAFKLLTPFTGLGNVVLAVGDYEAQIEKEKVTLWHNGHAVCTEKHIELHPVNTKEASFALHDVVIGVDFHWQRNEDQIFKGALDLKVVDGKIAAINIVPVEEYLKSVISSEMSATSSEELLKAHAVISRSWLLAQIQKNKQLEKADQKYVTTFVSDTEIVKWYDREDHLHFDVCADDHCQRYQGVTRSSTKTVVDAVDATAGEVLMFNDNICDARFSKCCGGVTEVFENAWEPINHPYLQKVIDNEVDPEGFSLDLERETSAQKWILGNPTAFCNTNSKEVLSQVLNDYDRETNDFYRWEITYSQTELSELVLKRSGIDFGTILDLIPVERGVSGRLVKLKIVGSKKTMVVGKELEIRKMLSSSHLYSSAFIVDKSIVDNTVTFTLKGAGWGHGVGLCQIGAAVMGHKGYAYQQILAHYFRGAQLVKRY